MGRIQWWLTHTYTRAHTLEGTLMWTQVVHVHMHTTRVSSADNRNNKHKQVVRTYKCMSQYRSDDTSGCTSGPHSPTVGHVTVM